MTDFYSFELLTRKTEKTPLIKLKGKIVVLVKTVTGYGFTTQYKDLEKFYEKFYFKGLEIIDVPCNNFRDQTPSSYEEIHQFYKLKYKTKFNKFKKSDVNGPNELPLFKFLKSQKELKKVLMEKKLNLWKDFLIKEKPWL